MALNKWREPTEHRLNYTCGTARTEQLLKSRSPISRIIESRRLEIGSYAILTATMFRATAILALLATGMFIFPLDHTRVTLRV